MSSGAVATRRYAASRSSRCRRGCRRRPCRASAGRYPPAAPRRPRCSGAAGPIRRPGRCADWPASPRTASARRRTSSAGACASSPAPHPASADPAAAPRAAPTDIGNVMRIAEPVGVERLGGGEHHVVRRGSAAPARHRCRRSRAGCHGRGARPSARRSSRRNRARTPPRPAGVDRRRRSRIAAGQEVGERDRARIVDRRRRAAIRLRRR